MGGILIFLWTTLIVEFVSGQCLAGWSLVGSTNVQCMICVGATVTADRRNWRGSLDYCNGQQGTLTGIHNTEQYAHVKTCVNNIPTGSKYAWIGLLRPGGGVGDDEVWTDGKVVTFGEGFIKDQQPAEECFVLYNLGGADYLYGDLVCTDPYPFVCSREPDTCLLPDDPQHATVVQIVSGPAGFAYSGNTLVYTCATGYETTDGLTRTCQADGTWNIPAPGCQPMVCPTLATPANGVVQVPSDRTYKSQACYSCDDGYQLNGNRIRTCTEVGGGTWDGADPTCAATTTTATTTTANTTTTASSDDSLPYIIAGSIAGGLVVGIAGAMIAVAASRRAAAAIPQGFPAGPTAPMYPFARPGGPRPIGPFRPY